VIKTAVTFQSPVLIENRSLARCRREKALQYLQGLLGFSFLHLHQFDAAVLRAAVVGGVIADWLG
jgi:hypothetical protein